MARRRSRSRLAGSSALALFAAAVLIGAGTGTAAAAPACATTPSSVVPGIQILDPSCGFTPLDGSSIYSGILHGTAYRIEIPKNWNHRLVMYAHGYAGTGNVVSVSDSPLRSFLVQQGYAWAASSYRQNGYDVGSGVLDTHNLMVHFPGLTHHAAPQETYMTGASMGGEITAVEIEYYRGQFTAAMPICGVLGANRLFDYFLGANVTAATLAAAPLQYPATPQAGTAYTPVFDQTVLQQIMPKLDIVPAPAGSPTTLLPKLDTPQGKKWVEAVENMSGGERPGADSAVGYWSSLGFAPLTNIPFLRWLYPGLTGGTIGYADGNVADNTHAVYQFDEKPGLTAKERFLNSEVLRVAATNTPSTNPNVTELPDVQGDPRIPVLSMHDIDDLFVPFSMEQIYARQVAAHGSNLFVSRAIRGTGHCEFTGQELATGFSDLIRWVHTGQRAAGDAILDPAVVSRRDFGCQFTDPDPTQHVFFGPSCASLRGSAPTSDG